MRTLISSLILSAALTAPAFAAHGGGGMAGGGAMHGGPAAPNHGMAVSQAAHTAQGSGAKVGPQVSSVARSGATASRVGTTNTTSKAVTRRTSTAANTHTNHGATVSQTAHAAKANGGKVGPQVRTVARSNAHGKTAATKTNHGARVSQTAHSAKANGGKVGPQVRTAARSKSKGPAHANSHALSQTNTHSRAAGNSVLGNRSVGH